MLETANQSAREQPWVSVIIPAYNVEDYIGRAIESALQQSISNIEVIVVDDASTDGTLSVVKGFAERDPRVNVIARDENGGAAAARNLGFDAANGEWVCPMDADDWFSPNRLSTLLEGAQDSAVDMIADDFYLVDYESLEPQTTFSQLNGDSFDRPIQITASFYVEQSNKALGHGSSPGFLKPLIRRSFLNDRNIRYREAIRITHDFFLYLDCLIAGAHFSFLPDPHYFYLVRPGSLCRSNDDKQLQRNRIYIQELQERLNDARVSADPELQKALLHKLAVSQNRLAYQSVAASFYRKHYLQAFTQALKNPIVFVHLLQSMSFPNIRRAFD